MLGILLQGGPADACINGYGVQRSRCHLPHPEGTSWAAPGAMGRSPATTWIQMSETQTVAAAVGAHVPALVYASSIRPIQRAPDIAGDESWPTNGIPTSTYSSAH